MENLNRNDEASTKSAALFSASNHEGMHDISPEEKREILNSIEEALARERGSFGDGIQPKNSAADSNFGSMKPMTHAGLKARKRSAPLPIWMNVGAFLLVGISSFLIWRFFGVKSGLETSASTGVISTEGLIVEQLREETQAELDAKNKELKEIRGRLEGVESEKLEVEEEFERRLTMREEELRAEFRTILEAERRRLIAAGISGNQLRRNMADYEAAAREKMELELAEARAQMKDEYESRIAELDARQNLYETQIDNYDAELERLTAEVASLESEIQSLAESEDSEALRTLKELQERRETEDGIRAQITAYYERLSNSWREGNSTAAIESLDSLNSYLNEPEIRESEVVRNNRSVNNFFITAFRRLVSLEETVNDMGTGRVASGEPVFGLEDLELARNEALAEAAKENRILEEQLSAFLRALDTLKNDYLAAYNAVFENNRDGSARITSLLDDKLRIKSDLESSTYAFFDAFIVSTNTLEVDGAREQIYGEFLEAIDELKLELRP